jgi:uncharacterized paraquat-inducible protein A
MKCPVCGKELDTANLCKPCKKSICPKCHHIQESIKKTSTPLAIIGTLILPFALILMLFAPELGYYLPNTECEKCKKWYSI